MQEQTRLSGESDLVWIELATQIWYTNKWQMHRVESVLENETQNSLGFWD